MTIFAASSAARQAQNLAAPAGSNLGVRHRPASGTWRPTLPRQQDNRRPPPAALLSRRSWEFLTEANAERSHWPSGRVFIGIADALDAERRLPLRSAAPELTPRAPLKGQRGMRPPDRRRHRATAGVDGDAVERTRPASASHAEAALAVRAGRPGRHPSGIPSPGLPEPAACRSRFAL
jgi:hypothetical protein